MVDAAILAADIASSSSLPIHAAAPHAAANRRTRRVHPSVSKNAMAARFNSANGVALDGCEPITLVDLKLSVDGNQLALYFDTGPNRKVAFVNRQVLTAALQTSDLVNITEDADSHANALVCAVPRPVSIMSLSYVKGVTTRDEMVNEVFNFFNDEISTPVVLPEQGILPPGGLPSDLQTLALNIVNAILLFQVFDVEWYFSTNPNMPFRARVSSAFYKGKTLSFLVYTSSGKYGPGVYDRPMLLRDAYFQSGHAQGLNLLEERTPEIVQAGMLHPSFFHSKSNNFLKTIHVVTGYRPSTVLVDAPLHECDHSLTLYDMFKWATTLQFRKDKKRRVKGLFYAAAFFRELSCGSLSGLMSGARKGRDNRMLAAESANILSALPNNIAERSMRTECAIYETAPPLCCVYLSHVDLSIDARSLNIKNAEASAGCLQETVRQNAYAEHRSNCRNQYRNQKVGPLRPSGRPIKITPKAPSKHGEKCGPCVCLVASFLPVNTRTADDILSVCHSSIDAVIADMSPSQIEKLNPLTFLLSKHPTLQFPLLKTPAMRHTDGTLREFKPETLTNLFNDPSATLSLDDLTIVEEQSSEERASIAKSMHEAGALARSVRSAHHRKLNMEKTNVIKSKKRKALRAARGGEVRVMKLTNMKQSEDVRGLLTVATLSTQDAATSQLIRRLVTCQPDVAEVETADFLDPLPFDYASDEEFHTEFNSLFHDVIYSGIAFPESALTTDTSNFQPFDHQDFGSDFMDFGYGGPFEDA